MTIDTQLPDADTNGIHDILFDTKDYTRRIHWWVRLFGVAWLVSIALAVVGFGVVSILASRTSGSFDDVNTRLGSTSYSECMADPDTTFAQCDRLR